MVSLFLFTTLVIIIFLKGLFLPGFGSRAALLRRGLDARGIVLAADRLAMAPVTVGAVRFERRSMRLDIEVPGRPPYEISAAPLIPRGCDAFPGSTLDLRVDPRKPSNIAIVGPAGSSGWMAAMPALFPGAVPGRRGLNGRVALILAVAILLDAIIVLAWLGQKSPTAPPSSPTPVQAATLRTTAPATTAKTSVGDTPLVCEAAARCCLQLGTAVGTTDCSAFRKMPESACRAALAAEKKGAARMKRVCE